MQALYEGSTTNEVDTEVVTHPRSAPAKFDNSFLDNILDNHSVSALAAALWFRDVTRGCSYWEWVTPKNIDGDVLTADEFWLWKTFNSEGEYDPEWIKIGITGKRENSYGVLLDYYEGSRKFGRVGVAFVNLLGEPDHMMLAIWK